MNTRPPYMHVVVRADGQPQILTMPKMTRNSTCGKTTCAHERCWLMRDRTMRRCAKCGERIAPGSQFTEHRNDVTGELISQQHVECPTKGVAA